MKLNYTLAAARRAAGRRPRAAASRSAGRSASSSCTASSRRSPGRSRRRAPGLAGRLRPDGRRRAARRDVGHGPRAAATAACSPATPRPARPTAARRRRSRRPARSTTGSPRRAGTSRSSVPARGSSAPARRSATAGIVALDSAHAALALGCPTRAAARMSSGDPRERHRGLSHHTRTVLRAAAARRSRSPVPPGVRAVQRDGRDRRRRSTPRARRARGRRAAIDLDGYRASGLPTRTMGRTLDEDRLFFAAALAAGGALAELVGRPGGAGMSAKFEQVGTETIWSGHIVDRPRRALPPRRRRGRHARERRAPRRGRDRRRATSTHVWLVRQPREICGEPALLEIPAGKLDVAGEDLRAAAKRELAEEIGKAAGRLGAPEGDLHEPRLHRRADRPLPRDRPARRPAPARRGGRADRDRPVAAGAPRRRDRRSAATRSR